MNKLFPAVVSLKTNTSLCFHYDKLVVFTIDNSVSVFLKDESLWKKDLKNLSFTNDQLKANLLYSYDEGIPKEGYKIEIVDDIIHCYYSDTSGAFYASKTLEQILLNKEIYNLDIYDYPQTKVRGYMLDISRDKVASVETIKKVIDLMADLKMNHFELYVEGFSFEYKSFKKYLLKDGYIKVKEYLEIQEYCKKRFIDFVGNVNGFGHMAKWLELDDFKDLAVAPDGIFLWGRWRKPTTLNPLDDRSINLVKKIYKDIIPLTTSEFFNMNFDEPFELGHGRTEGMDRGDLYIDYMTKAYNEIKKYKKIPLIWGDVLLKHMDKLDRLPKDMVFIDWGYDSNYPFDRHAKVLKSKDIKFMTAPGTTSWCSFLGRYLDWHENILNACLANYHYGGEGVLLTDWGDFGHLQFLPVSYAPLMYCGLLTWSMKEGEILNVRDYLNMYYGDKNNVIGDLLLDLSSYNKYDVSYNGNGTKSFYYFMWMVASMNDGKDNPIEYYKSKIGSTNIPYEKFKLVGSFFDNKLKEFNYVSSDLVEFNQTKAELTQSIKLIRMIHKVSLAFNESVNVKERIKYLEEVIKAKNSFISNQKKLWKARNKTGGLLASLSYIESFMEFTNITLNYLKNGEQ